jgi:hypothetical protein
MDGLSIIALALGVGAIVYVLSLRSPDEPLEADPLPPARARSRAARLRRRSAPPAEDRGFGYERAPSVGEPEPEAVIYVPILHSAEPRWRTRVGSGVGLLLLVVAAALAVAVAIYQLGHAVNQMIQGFIGS